MDNARAHRRPDRRGNFDRLGDSRFPRSAGRVDQESGRGEAVGYPSLRRRPRGAQGFVAEPRRSSGLQRAAQCWTPARWSRWSGVASCTPSSPRTSTACTSEAGKSPDPWLRCTATCTRLSARVRAQGADAGNAGPRAGGRGDPEWRECGGMLKSETISFGQALFPRSSSARGLRRRRPTCCSPSGARFRCTRWRGGSSPQAGARVVIVNAEETPFDAWRTRCCASRSALR